MATPKPKPKPKSSPSPKPKSIASAEKLLQDAIKSGKIKNIKQLTQAKQSIAASTGVWPNGKTN